MTRVLPFPRAKASNGQQPAFPIGHKADILLFTGVRYERHAEPQNAAPDGLGRDDNASARRRKARRRA